MVIEETTDEEVTGEASEVKDDAKPTASCPAGKVVTHCESSTGKLFTKHVIATRTVLTVKNISPG